MRDAKPFSEQVEITVLDRTGKEIDRFSLRGGTNLWVFLRKRGHPIGSACSGVGVCGACHVFVACAQGESCTSAVTPLEKETLAKQGRPQEARLACLCRVFGDLTVRADYW